MMPRVPLLYTSCYVFSKKLLTTKSSDNQAEIRRSSISQLINQSKHISIAPYVASESETSTMLSYVQTLSMQFEPCSELVMGQFLLTQSNPIQSIISGIKSNS